MCPLCRAVFSILCVMMKRKAIGFPVTSCGTTDPVLGRHVLTASDWDKPTHVA
jgi:hypothetical protein